MLRRTCNLFHNFPFSPYLFSINSSIRTPFYWFKYVFMFCSCVHFEICDFSKTFHKVCFLPENLFITFVNQGLRLFLYLGFTSTFGKHLSYNEINFLKKWSYPAFASLNIFRSFQSTLCKFCLILSWRRSLSYWNPSIYLECKSMDWFIYDRGICHKRIKMFCRNMRDHSLKVWLLDFVFFPNTGFYI